MCSHEVRQESWTPPPLSPPRPAAMDRFVQLLLLHSLVSYTGAQLLPPWEEPTFYFGWGQENNTFTRCGFIDLTWSQRPGFAYTPVGPYTIIVYRPGQMPWRVSAGNGPTFRWTVNLNVGGPYLFGMDDVNGATGGTSNSFMMVPGSFSCPASGETAQTLSVKLLTSSVAACSTLSFEVAGGTPPYTLSVIRAPDPPKVVIFASPRFDHVLDVPGGVAVAFVVEDSAGRGSVVEAATVQQSSNTSCLTLAPTILPAPPTTTYPGITTSSSPSSSTRSATGPNSDSASATSSGYVATNPNPPNSKKSSGPPIPAIAGGAAGGLAVIGLLVLFAILRRKKKRQQSGQNSSMEQKDNLVSGIQPNSPSHPSMSIAGTSARAPSLLSEQQTQHNPPSPWTAEQPGEIVSHHNPANLVQPYSQFQTYNEQRRLSAYDPNIPAADSSRTSHYSNAYLPPTSSSPSSSNPNPGAPKEEKKLSWISATSSSVPSSPPIRRDTQANRQSIPASSQTTSPADRSSRLTDTSAGSFTGSTLLKHAPAVSYSPPPRTVSPPLPQGAMAPFQAMTLEKDPGQIFGDPNSAPSYSFHPDMLPRLTSPAISTSRSPPPQYTMD